MLKNDVNSTLIGFLLKIGYFHKKSANFVPANRHHFKGKIVKALKDDRYFCLPRQNRSIFHVRMQAEFL